MNECNRCRKIFESPVERFEADTGYREMTCPYCGDDDISEAHECPICHTNYTSEDFCQECYDTVNQSLTELNSERHRKISRISYPTILAGKEKK